MDNSTIPNPVTKSTLDDWMKHASATTGFSPEKVKELLRERYTSFKPSNASKMMAYLMQKRDEEITKLEEKIIESVTPVPIPKCPICGEDTIPDSRWDGRFTRTPGWRCKVGGLEHFLYAKANEIRRLQGLPILFEEKDDKEPDVDDDTELDGDTEAILPENGLR